MIRFDFHRYDWNLYVYSGFTNRAHFFSSRLRRKWLKFLYIPKNPPRFEPPNSYFVPCKSVVNEEQSRINVPPFCVELLDVGAVCLVIFVNWFWRNILIPSTASKHLFCVYLSFFFCPGTTAALLSLYSVPTPAIARWTAVRRREKKKFPNLATRGIGI